MFEALFILTTVDAGTRVARFMLSDGLGNLGGPLKRLHNPSWRVGAWLVQHHRGRRRGASILLMGVTDPLGGINTLFPLFGIANQLLAAIALTVVTVVVIKKGLLKWAWIPGVPLLWDLIVTLTASWQKIFSGDPEARLLDAALPVPRGPGGGQDGVRVGQERRPARRGGSQHLHPGHAVDRVRGRGDHRGRGRRRSMALALDPRWRTSAGRGDPGAVEDLRAVEPDSPPQPRRRCRSNGTRYRSTARQIRWYVGALMGDNHYRATSSTAAARIPVNRCSARREYWRMRHHATDTSPTPRCC